MLRKTALITGASGGIGSACAREFAKNGYNVALTYNSHSTKALERELKKFNVEVKSYKLDQTNDKEISDCIKTIFSDFDYIDVAVCNAGKAEKVKLLAEKSTKEIDDILNVNLRGTILVNREILKHMTAQKHGNIVNVASIYGLTGGECEAIYSAAKAGIIGLTKSIANEVAPIGIRVNAVAPGCIDTNMTKGYNEEDRKWIVDATPLGRIGEPEDVANLVYFLACDKANFITGECFSTTGGVVKF